jgi:UDP-glucose 4-epimerase
MSGLVTGGAGYVGSPTVYALSIAARTSSAPTSPPLTRPPFRDYIHVRDLATAHLLALDPFTQGR